MNSNFHTLSLVPNQSDNVAPGAAAPCLEAFDLSRAILGAKLCTRLGLPAELVRVDEAAPPEFRLKVRLPQYSYPRSFCDNGKYRSDGADDDFDLFIATEKSNVGEQPNVSIAA